MRNPYTITAIAVLMAVVIAVFVAFVFGRSSSANRITDVEVDGVVSQSQTATGRGVVAPVIEGASVREGPSLDSLALGEMARSQNVDVVGRNRDGSWLVIYYPPGSMLRGWVPASAVSLSIDAASLPQLVLTPIPQPTVPRPTSAPASLNTVLPSPSTTVLQSGPDLAASIAQGACAFGHELVVTVTDVNQVSLNNKPITVLIQTAAGQSFAVPSSPTTLAPRGKLDFKTGYVVRETVVATIDPLNQLGDPNQANNGAVCSLAEISPPLPSHPPSSAGPTQPRPP